MDALERALAISQPEIFNVVFPSKKRGRGV